MDTKNPNVNQVSNTINKPTLTEKALSGLAGSVVNCILPHTEADAAALLSQLLVAFGNITNRSPHFIAEEDRHGTNLFILNVGDSSKGRKGSSWGRIERIFKEVDPEWSRIKIKSGLSSGEGLIEAIKDQEHNEFETILSSPTDKRLLILESEFGQVLRVLSREGNTLSAVLRNAWDGKNLSSLTKNNSVQATNPHISIIGHITKFELNKLLNQNEISNGLGNRFLFFYVQRSKSLPEGSQLDEVDFKLLVDEIKASINFASTTGLLRRDESAKKLWANLYEELSGGQAGLIGSLSARGEAQVMRMALIQAVINRHSEITSDDLEAAFAIFSYCKASLNYIYGFQTGDRLADRIKDFLDDAGLVGLTRTDISNRLNKNQTSAEITNALSLLLAAQLAVKTHEQTNKKGTERWFSTKFTLNAITDNFEDSPTYPYNSSNSSVSFNSSISLDPAGVFE